MGTFNGNKPPSYVLAADNISPDSLSFSGFVSNQDQQSKSPSVPLNQSKQQHDQTTNQSPEFEFIVTKPTPKPAAANSVKEAKPKHANLLISTKQHQPQVISFQSNHTDHHHTSSLSSLLSAHHGNGQRVGSGNTRKYDGGERGRRPRSKSFGGKIFKTLVSPCRDCHAFKPKAKVH